MNEVEIRAYVDVLKAQRNAAMDAVAEQVAIAAGLRKTVELQTAEITALREKFTATTPGEQK